MAENIDTWNIFMNFPQQYKQSCVGFFFGPSLFPHLDGPEFSTFFINILKVAFLHPDPDLRVPMLVEKTLVLEHQALLVRLPISPGMTTHITRSSLKPTLPLDSTDWPRCLGLLHGRTLFLLVTLYQVHEYSCRVRYHVEDIINSKRK